MIMAIRCTIRSAVSAVAIAAASSVALADMGRAPVNGNTTADLVIKLTGLHTLTAGDFIL